MMLMLLCLTVQIHAQDKDKRVVKKTIKKEVHKDDHQEISKSIDIEREIVDGKEVETYVIKIKKNGVEKVLRWNGEGEMPKEIKAILEEEDEIEIDQFEEYEIVEIKEEDEDGSTKIMKWKSGDEMSEEMKDKIIELKGDDFFDEDERGSREVIIIEESEDNWMPDVNVKMGIGLDAGEDGVIVAYVEKDSPAEKAKMQKGDTVLKIDDQYIFTDRTLMNTLSNYNAGDEINVKVLREGKEKDLKLVLASK